MSKYDIDSLIAQFEQDWHESEKRNAECKADFIKKYPDAPVPEHFSYTFNIARAFMEMCKEIKGLKDER